MGKGGKKGYEALAKREKAGHMAGLLRETRHAFESRAPPEPKTL